MARTKPKFDNRGIRIVGLSVDPVEAADIKDTQGMAPNYPMIGDADLEIAKACAAISVDAQEVRTRLQ